MSNDKNISLISKSELADAIREYNNRCNKIDSYSSLTKEEIDSYSQILNNTPIPIDEFIDFYHDNLRQKKEKVALYLKVLLNKDFIVDFFIFDPRINVFNCYGKFDFSDYNILNKYNKMSTFYKDDINKVSFTGKYSHIKVYLYDIDYDDIFPEILANRLFEILGSRDDIY